MNTMFSHPQAHTHLRAFVLTVPSAWNAVSLDICITNSPQIEVSVEVFQDDAILKSLLFHPYPVIFINPFPCFIIFHST